MLNEAEQREIEAELQNYPNRRAVCIEALAIVQQHRGWVSDEALADVAEFLQLSTSELEGVATFYNMIFRSPVGRHVILLCDSVSCWIMGADRLRERLGERLGIEMGETSVDGRFTLLPNVCLGACDHAPVMMIDKTHHEDLDPTRLDAILDGLEQRASELEAGTSQSSAPQAGSPVAPAAGAVVPGVNTSAAGSPGAGAPESGASAPGVRRRGR